MIAWIAIGITLIGNVLSLGYVYGNISVRVHTAESDIKDLRSDMRGLGEVKVQIAGTTSQLTNINTTLERMERRFNEMTTQTGNNRR